MDNQQNERSEALFQSLDKQKKKRRRKILRTVLIVILLVAVILVGVVIYLQKQVRERFASTTAEVSSYAATRGTISTTVSGSGTLTQVDLESVTVPSGVEITEVLVKNQDEVSAGDVLATVDMASVMSAMSDIQAQIDDLDEEIGDAKGEEAATSITAGVSGRVKLLYAAAGDDVAASMAENGALALLSLDGYMAVDVETELLSKGGSVTVTLSDGTTVSGTVETVFQGKATVLVTDNGPEYGEEVTVLTEDGTQAGTGALYIHNPLAVTGYAGTVKSVAVSENQKVSASTKVFYLKDTSYSANYETLLRERAELEETLMELLTIYRDGAILADMDGIVSSVEYTGSDSTGLVTLYPNVSMSVTIGVDETDILSLEVGQEVDITVSSVSEDSFTGTVTEISKTATTSSGVTQYSAVVTLDKQDGMLAGMTASVEVKIEGVEDAIIIPVEALHQTSAISFVYTSYDEETGVYGGMVEVTTGMQNSSYVEITSGLSEGDTVYYTESTTGSFFGGMGNMGNMGGMGDMSGGFSGEMPSGGDMPSGGGQMPDMGGSKTSGGRG